MLKLYNLAKGGLLKALWELYIKLVKANNWVIIYNLANILNIGKNVVSYRLIKSILSKTLNNKIE